MSGRLPVQVDPLDLADKRREIEGDLPVSTLRRLGGWLHSDEGMIAVRLRFGRDEGGRRVMQGRLDGELQLVCQRCLAPFALPIGRPLDLVLVETEAEAGLVPEELEPLVVGEKRGVHTVDLLEDELILALPLVPRCGDFGHACEPATELLASEGVSRTPGDENS